MAADERDERTPLLSNPSGDAQRNGTTGSAIAESNGAANGKKKESWVTRVFGPPNTIKVLLAGFIITFSFSFTQVPIFYVFHLMECDVYYDTHPPFTGPGDRCSINEIAAGTAKQYSLLGMSTTFCGTLNLFLTGWTVKKWGPRFALIVQTFVPGIRVLTQIFGVIAGGNAGITIIQTTQLITILGGPAGYILVVNTIAGELVEPMRRTAVFGQLQGCIMLGQAISYLLGGMVGDTFGIRMPFQVAFFLFMFATLYARTVLPYISPDSLSDGKQDSKAKGIKGFLAPLRILAPQRIRFFDGHVAKHYGVFFLCCGLFLGVLATGYAPLLIQMYATAYFDFNQSDNGWLMSGNALCRSAFLFFIFPRIVDAGRKWWIKKSKDDDPTPVPRKPRRDDEQPNTLSRISSRPGELEAPVGSGNQMLQEESMPQPETKAEEERAACRFDLFFLRWSLLVDGLLTAGAALCTKGWHVYLAAFLLPFGSGSAPAGKGVITEMCPHSQRTDALNAVTLVENIARLATQGLFGYIFSALAETGQAYLTFYINAAIAIVAMAVLFLSYFPPLDSTMVDDLDEDEEDEEGFRDEDNLVRVTSHETDR
ncbi:hypothetical protein VP1G_05077 [Cytospora mali]|uniref:Major facilitator superfamily (MFS) profile domain-containing protein n=1 Tax=Cytospora mali TaxID=578113 RepID=A0A194V1I8_CYTMA|nr:hypothetical protein VP1G_05077 [Valsa mali var. pyri (nom. inval.)]